MGRKIEPIKLFGKELLLSERMTGDVVALLNDATNLPDNIKPKTDAERYTDILINAVAILADGLKINIDNLEWYNFIKKNKYPKLFDKKYLLNNLTPTEVMDYAAIVYKLDGLTEAKNDEDSKKKVESNTGQ